MYAYAYGRLFSTIKELCLPNFVTQWLFSYLSKRQQSTLYSNNKVPELSRVKYGVPQGSILGPLLYILYTNSVARVFESCKDLMYADDLTMYISGRNPDELIV